jgi:hypothetical protein
VFAQATTLEALSRPVPAPAARGHGSTRRSRKGHHHVHIRHRPAPFGTVRRALFYTYTGALGVRSITQVDIASFLVAVAVAVGQWTSCRLIA